MGRRPIRTRRVPLALAEEIMTNVRIIANGESKVVIATSKNKLSRTVSAHKLALATALTTFQRSLLL